MNIVLMSNEKYSVLDISTETHNNVSTLIDTEDLERVLSFNKWYVLGGTYGIRVMCTDKKLGHKKNVFLHRFILNCPEGLEVDHINGNTLFNTKSNLRICTRQQNGMNIHSQTLKGITRARNGWMAQIKYNGKRIYLGYRSNKEEAALLYNNAAVILFGEFANVNKIGGK